MLTVVWPPLVVCVGVLAPTQLVTGLATPGAARPLLGTKPPRLRPLTVLGAFAASPRATFWAARIAWIAWVARVIEACEFCAACCACCAADCAAFIAASVAAVFPPPYDPNGR